MTTETGAVEQLPEVATTELDDKDVAAYLKENPDFFLSHQDLLADLTLPHESGTAVSLLERQVSLLRERNNSTRAQLGSLLANANKNDQLFAITRRLILALLRAQSKDKLAEDVRRTFTDQENIDACALVLADDEKERADGELRRSADISRVFANVFRLNHTHCGKPESGQLEFLFGAAADTIRSSAICPIRMDGKPLGILAIGSNRNEYFNLDLDTLFLDFIGNVIAAVLEGQLSR